MRIEQLQQILEIQKHKSISKAAKSLYISQPSLSNSLSSFENEIKVEIFERTHSGVKPTAQGEDILCLIEQALDEINKIRFYSCEKKDYTGEVRVLHSPAYGFMTYKLIQAMKTLYPKVDLILDQRPVDEVINGMLDGISLIGVVTWGIFPEQTPKTLFDLGFAYRKMNSRHLKAYVSSAHPLADQEEISLSELKEQQFISYSSTYWKRIDEGFHVNQEALIMKDAEDVKKGVYKGQNIALLPDLFAIDDVYCEHGLIKLISVEGDISMEGYDCILYPSKKALSALEKDVINLIEKILCDEEVLCPE